MSYNSCFVKYPLSIQLRLFHFNVKSKEPNYLENNVQNFTHTGKQNKKNLFETVETEIDCTVCLEYPERSRIVSLNHSKQKIFYLARSNDWTGGYFITLTFNPEIINSFDYDACNSCIKKFIKNLKYYDDSVKVLIVPEKHKSGRYHYHGLIKGNISNILQYSGIIKNGDMIYNFNKCWNYGFTTATKIKNSLAVEKYITKYTTKELLTDIKYKHRYFQANLNKSEYNRTFIHPDFYDSLFKELYSNDLVEYHNSSGCYNRVNYLELKNNEKVLQIIKKYVIMTKDITNKNI